MAKRFQPGIVSANDLLSGAVIYLAENGNWVSTMSEAEFITDADRAEERLSFAERQPEIAVGPYIAPADNTDAGPVPNHFRETFRAQGPSAPARKSWGGANA
ncbi:DUF2849 domain-containing protein [Maritimibacter sp. DP07]|jgi:hypothetical protein|uniref:DUF2849 domain-containing protein n=1 Tax=Maritimibacter harenae TaxID=2606218 RepID=A0A845M232_9RHOB|nr:DUF2849 domain-containing protein [Maritimibacter harenae]MZR13079.1 DUF2849 domain-containing protein [Maritimibacter harenae]